MSSRFTSRTTGASFARCSRSSSGISSTSTVRASPVMPGDHALGRRRLGRVDAPDRRAQIVLAESLDRDRARRTANAGRRAPAARRDRATCRPTSTSPSRRSGNTPYCSSQSADSAVVSRSTSSSSVAECCVSGRSAIATRDGRECRPADVAADGESRRTGGGGRRRSVVSESVFCDVSGLSRSTAPACRRAERCAVRR